MKILFVGDVVGESGKQVIKERLSRYKISLKPQLTIVNGENITDGRGISEQDYKFLLNNGADVVTLGNHAFDQSNIYRYIQSAKCLVRPYNLPKETPGKGVHYIKINDVEIAVINLLGSVYIQMGIDPFYVIDDLIKEVRKRTHNIIIDFHAEVTSEKQAFAHYLDGQVSAVVGTHTHVQTNDAQILPKGTAYITDVGMSASQESILGFSVESSVNRFRWKLPRKLELAQSTSLAMGAVLIQIDPRIGLAQSIDIVKD